MASADHATGTAGAPSPIGAAIVRAAIPVPIASNPKRFRSPSRTTMKPPIARWASATSTRKDAPVCDQVSVEQREPGPDEERRIREQQAGRRGLRSSRRRRNASPPAATS